jgi:hypothetical protein
MEGQEGSAGTSYAFMSFTDAGMLALWNPRRFADIVDYESWERQLYDDDDILRHVRDGHLVPVNIGGDGAFDFTVRTATDGDATPTEREAHAEIDLIVQTFEHFLETNRETYGSLVS